MIFDGESDFACRSVCRFNERVCSTVLHAIFNKTLPPTAHACRPPLRTSVVAHRAQRMAPCPRRVPIAMRTPALRRPHGDRPVALRSPLKDRTATARHGNALRPPEGTHAWARRPRVPLELCRRERPKTGGEEWRRRRDSFLRRKIGDAKP